MGDSLSEHIDWFFLISKERGWSTRSISECDKRVDHGLDGGSNVHSPKDEEDASDRQDGLVDWGVTTDSQVIDRSGKYGYIKATVRQLTCQLSTPEECFTYH